MESQTAHERATLNGNWLYFGVRTTNLCGGRRGRLIEIGPWGGTIRFELCKDCYGKLFVGRTTSIGLLKMGARVMILQSECQGVHVYVHICIRRPWRRVEGSLRAGKTLPLSDICTDRGTYLHA